MFIYWIGECDTIDDNTERKIEYDKSNLYLVYFSWKIHMIV
jgi:hypothetical protein